MPKSLLHLSIDTDLIIIAKEKGINISNLLEQTLSNFIKTDIKRNEEKQFNYDKEIEQKLIEIETLKAKKKLDKELDREKEKNKYEEHLKEQGLL